VLEYQKLPVSGGGDTGVSRRQSLDIILEANGVNAVTISDGKEPEPSKNEPNQNPGFAKNRTELEPENNKRLSYR